MTAIAEVGKRVEELLLCKGSFHYEGVDYVEFETVEDFKRCVWIKASEVEHEMKSFDYNAFLIRGEVSQWIPLKTMPGADQEYETILENCEIIERIDMRTYEHLDQHAKNGVVIIPCVDESDSFFETDFEVGRMIETTFTFEAEGSPFSNTYLLKEKDKGGEKRRFFMIDEDDHHVRLIAAEKSPVVYCIEKQKLRLFFEPKNTRMFESIEKLTFHSVGINSSFPLSGVAYNMMFDKIFLYNHLLDESFGVWSRYYENVCAESSRILSRKGKKKNEMDVEVYFFGQTIAFDSIETLVLSEYNHYFAFTKEEEHFSFDEQGSCIHEGNGFTRKKYLGDETKPHFLDNISHTRLYGSKKHS